MAGGGGGGDTGTLALAYSALFGSADALIGYGSYLPAQSATQDILSVASGFAYDEPTDAVVTSVSTVSLNFAGQTTGTYYVHADASGYPYFDASSDGALYSVDYDQSSHDFSNITRVANLFESMADQENGRTNSWSISYPTLGERIDGTEKAAFYVLLLTAEGDDLTLTNNQAFEQSVIYIADGPQTADIDLNVPAQPRVYTVINAASASYSVNIVPSGGTGYAIEGKNFAILYCDGSSVVPLFVFDQTSGTSPASRLTDLLDFPSSYSGQALKVVRVASGETGVEFADLGTVGDVAGPASATDAAIVLFDGTTGKLVKDSGTTIASLGGGDVTGPGSSTDSSLAAFDGTGGDTLKEAGYGLNDAGTGTTDLWSADKIASEISSAAGTAEAIRIVCSDMTSSLTTGTAKVTFRMPFAMTLTALPRASVNTAPAGSTIIVDINEEGTSIFSTRLTIDAGEKTSTTAATAAVLSDTSLADDAEITVDLDQIGSSTPGKGLVVTLLGERT